jgi:glycyl-tRNA synthetase (class II)
MYRRLCPIPPLPQSRWKRSWRSASAAGFIFQSSEIYGGINGFFDYGPLGVPS